MCTENMTERDATLIYMTFFLLAAAENMNFLAVSYVTLETYGFEREVKRFTDLTVEETTDLWLTVHKIVRQLESYHKATSLTFTIQDGPQAGQSVPHVHIHIVPRKSGDFEYNDEIYDAIDEKEKDLNKKQEG